MLARRTVLPTPNIPASRVVRPGDDERRATFEYPVAAVEVTAATAAAAAAACATGDAETAAAAAIDSALLRIAADCRAASREQPKISTPFKIKLAPGPTRMYCTEDGFEWHNGTCETT